MGGVGHAGASTEDEQMARMSMHGRGLRGLSATSLVAETTGRFGRMFHGLPPCPVLEEDLAPIAASMLDKHVGNPLGAVDAHENVRIPAGYTYFGQFVDHDITLDTASTLDRIQDPEGLIDFRTPRLDLDSLYGRGPADQPYLYESDGLHLAAGTSLPTGSGQTDQLRSPCVPPPAGGFLNSADAAAEDEARKGAVALIGDSRNDENMIVAQMHSTFLAFHNRRCNDLAALGPVSFVQVANDVRWHYQYVIVNDFLPRICGKEIIKKLVEPILKGEAPPLQFYAPQPDGFPFMPVEFSVAAYRLGHSMVRPAYHLNDGHPGLGIGSPTNRIPLFGGSASREDLRGFAPIAGASPRDFWGIQWKYFLEFDEELRNGVPDTAPLGAGFPGPAFSFRIDTHIADPLGALPGAPPPELAAIGGANSLPFRNLLRGRALKLPSGQSVADAMGNKKIDLSGLPDLRGSEASPDYRTNTPLWYYILKEAELLKDGEALGPTGARIVAETFLGLLWHDPHSYLRAHPWWQPTIGPGNTFGLQHLVAYTLGIPGAKTSPEHLAA
jgi:hypothetical protein